MKKKILGFEAVFTIAETGLLALFDSADEKRKKG